MLIYEFMFSSMSAFNLSLVLFSFSRFVIQPQPAVFIIIIAITFTRIVSKNERKYSIFYSLMLICYVFKHWNGEIRYLKFWNIFKLREMLDIYQFTQFR